MTVVKFLKLMYVQCQRNGAFLRFQFATLHELTVHCMNKARSKMKLKGNEKN